MSEGSRLVVNCRKKNKNAQPDVTPTGANLRSLPFQNPDEDVLCMELAISYRKERTLLKED